MHGVSFSFIANSLYALSKKKSVHIESQYYFAKYIITKITPKADVL